MRRKKKKQIDYRVLITGIISITILTSWALYLGYDGVLLTTVLMLIAGVIGVTLPQWKTK